MDEKEWGTGFQEEEGGEKKEDTVRDRVTEGKIPRIEILVLNFRKQNW